MELEIIKKNVNKFIHLFKKFTTEKADNIQVKRRIQLGWITFGKIKNILQSKIDRTNQASTVLSYIVETWKIRLKNKFRNSKIRKKT